MQTGDLIKRDIPLNENLEKTQKTMGYIYPGKQKDQPMKIDNVQLSWFSGRKPSCLSSFIRSKTMMLLLFVLIHDIIRLY